jgi:hypothetical protein
VPEESARKKYGEKCGDEHLKTHDRIGGMKKGTQVVLAVVLGMFSSGIAVAQQKTELAALPDAPVPKVATEPEQAPAGAGAGQQNDTGQPQEKKGPGNPLGLIARRSFFYPELASTPGPLTAGQKFKLFMAKSISPPQLLSSLATAGVTQALNDPPGYGQGGDAFAERFGASMAVGASSNFFGTFLLASILHQDPRYFPLQEGGFGKRVVYALRRTVVTRRDSGGNVFDWSGTMGPLGAVALANSYLPDSERTVGKTFERYGIRIGFGAANNILKEFWPTIFKTLRMDKVAPGLGPAPDKN